MSKKVMVKRTAVKKTAAKRNIVRKSAPAAMDEKTRQALFVVTEHWMSDLQFFNDELRFFRGLIDRYFMWLIEEKNIESTRLVATRLARAENERLALERKVSDHLRHLSNLIANPFSHDAHDYAAEHATIEKAVADFSKDFRAVKREVFKISEEAIDFEKHQHLIGRRSEGETGTFIVKKPVKPPKPS